MMTDVEMVESMCRQIPEIKQQNERKKEEH